MPVAVVDSFAELARRPFAAGADGIDGVNALCWPRSLDGDFEEIARLLAPTDGVVEVTADDLRALPLGAAGRRAADLLLADMHQLDALGRDPVLNCITRYERDERGLAIATDVYSFHADRAPVAYDTWLCTYAGKSSDGLEHRDARRRIDDPAIAAALRLHHRDLDDAQFRALVRDESFDLHYDAVAGAQPYAFGVGAMWRIAVDWPGSAVLPCLHRAPRTHAGDPPRLLLIC